MKLQISFDQLDLDAAIEVAQNVAPYADILEVGTIMLAKHGVDAVKKFSIVFPDKTILADSKIIDQGTQSVNIYSDSGATWLTVMAGAPKDVIRTVCTAAHNQGKKVMMDLLDASSLGQAALEAQSFGIDALVFRQSFDESNKLEFLDNWEMVRGNTKLPIFISCQTDSKRIEEIIKLKPQGIIIGHAITHAPSAQDKAHYYHELINSK